MRLIKYFFNNFKYFTCLPRLVGGGVPAAQLARGHRDGLEAGLVAVGGVLADQRQQNLQVLGDVVLHQEGLGVRHAVLLQLHDVVRTIVRRADLQILRAHLGLHLRAEVGEQHVAREVGLELGLGVALGHGELEAAGGAHQHVAISDWLAVNHCEDVPTRNENMLLLYLLASEEQWLQDCLIHHLVLLRNLHIVACNFLGENRLTPEGFVLVHRLVGFRFFGRLRTAPSEKAHS